MSDDFIGFQIRGNEIYNVVESRNINTNNAVYMKLANMPETVWKHLIKRANRMQHEYAYNKNIWPPTTNAYKAYESHTK